MPQGIFVAAGHPFLGIQPVKRRDLVRYRQLLMHVDDYKTPAYSHKVWRSDSFQSITEMVADDLGWAALSLNIAMLVQHSKPLREVVCPSISLPLLSVRMIWCQGRHLRATERWIASRFAELLGVVDKLRNGRRPATSRSLAPTE